MGCARNSVQSVLEAFHDGEVATGKASPAEAIDRVAAIIEKSLDGIGQFYEAIK